MKAKRSVLIWSITVVIILGVVVFQFFKLDNIKDIPGEFEKVAYIRNQNNQGGIYQYYAYSVGDLNLADYEALMEMIPFHGKAGETTVFFFDKNNPYPQELSLESPYYDTLQFQPVAVYARTQSQIYQK